MIASLKPKLPLFLYTIPTENGSALTLYSQIESCERHRNDAGHDLFCLNDHGSAALPRRCQDLVLHQVSFGCEHSSSIRGYFKTLLPYSDLLCEESFAGWGREGFGEAVADFGELSEFHRAITVKLVMGETPAPVIPIKAGRVHARFAPQAEDVLQRNDTEARRRAIGCTNEGPVDAVIAAPDVSFSVPAFVIRGAGIPPADNGVVVVGAGVNDFARGAMRQIHVGSFVAEAELQNCHAGNLQALSQGVNFGRDVAKVFRKEWQSTESFAEFDE